MTSGFLKHGSLCKGGAAREGMFKAGTFLVIQALTSEVQEKAPLQFLPFP